MGSKWRKVKVALGLNLCVYTPRNHAVADDADDDADTPPPSGRRSDAALLSPPGDWTSAPSTPASNRLRLSKSLSRSSSKKTCSICLGSIRRGDGQAIFTAECCHTFHFHCIAANVEHGSRVCPVCRAQWKEVPATRPDPPLGRARISPVDWPQINNDPFPVAHRLPPPRSNSARQTTLLNQATEPAIYNDDDPLDHKPDPAETTSSSDTKLVDHDHSAKVDVNTYTEVSSVPRSSQVDNFTVLVHIKAPVSNSGRNDSNLAMGSHTSRAPVDLVTVLDISGSMAGTKLALLKRAMGFVIQNLGPNDRLSVIAFSSTARRLFHLRKMSEAGRQLALHAVNSLVANGGTNIAEGLRKGAKIMEERREKNPVSSVILLSDGQDTYTVSNFNGNRNQPDYQMLLPLSLRPDASSGFKIPVHAFGFGADHDALSMHSISEISGGTFSFIETEGVIQDAFAQCIGGLLSVVVKDLRVEIECDHPTTRLDSMKVGSYPSHVTPDRRSGCINVGDLYADEERDFLIVTNIPIETSKSVDTPILKVKCVYNNPISKESATSEYEHVRIARTDGDARGDVSIEVDRQRNRVRAAEAMVQAQSAAENGSLSAAVEILEKMRKRLSETASAKSNDQLCVALDAELKEMQERMASRHVYEASGRAYILSGLSSHSWQRATARGDSTDGSSLVQSYQTPSMVEMVSRSQASLIGGGPDVQRLLQPGWSFGGGRQPRPR
ncbi:E3 ubiquitin-protein ligase WAV3 [Andrographis paniculata]|uniref:E3 ubiquitin-protein ligase WAV3 n=1 Tax=Andrographis paniculata TaxID=175694 RepID=UPI0021E72072|nr:E3 ubiquitin-protein ligase WAV3 [Andrographis paniculata]